MTEITQGKSIPLIYCFDSNYAFYAAVSTYSAWRYSRSLLDIYWITPIKDEQNAYISASYLKKYDIKLKIIPIDNNYFKSWKETLHISIATYLRLLIPTIIPLDKAIYIDCDTLVLSDLGNLYDTDVSSVPICGIIDERGGATSQVPRSDDDPYINGGILLMNLKYLRDDAFLQKSQDIYELYGEKVTWWDQCIINKYAENNKLIIPNKWNYQIFGHEISRNAFRKILDSDPSILHFVGSVKPWQEWCNPDITTFWLKYANQVLGDNIGFVKMTTVDQAIILAGVLELNEDYSDAGKLKTKIIQALMQELRKKASS